MRAGKVISLMLLCLSLWGVSAFAQNTKKQEKERARLQKEIEILNRQLKDNAAAGSKALSSLDLVRRKITVQKELVADAEHQIHVLDDSIGLTQRQIAQLQARNDTLTLYYGRLVRSAYKNRDSRLWYLYILSSDNLGQAFRRVGYLRGFSRQMSEQSRRLRENEAALELEKERLTGLKGEAENLRQERSRDMAAIRADESKAEGLIQDLNRQKKDYEKQLAQKNKQVEALNREIANLIAKAQAEAEAKRKKAEAEAAKSGNKSASGGGKAVDTTVDTRLSNEFAANKGKLPWPVEGTVVESYGQHDHPVYKNVKMPFNNGVTVAVAHGAQARAVFDGVVSQVIVAPGYNQCVLVQHGDYFTFYCKLKSVAVRSGDKITTGQVLGTVDTIGGETLFHFQLWQGRQHQNPESWLK